MNLPLLLTSSTHYIKYRTLDLSHFILNLWLLRHILLYSSSEGQNICLEFVFSSFSFSFSQLWYFSLFPLSGREEVRKRRRESLFTRSIPVCVIVNLPQRWHDKATPGHLINAEPHLLKVLLEFFNVVFLSVTLLEQQTNVSNIEEVLYK